MSNHTLPPEVEKALSDLVGEASQFFDDPDERPWRLRCIIHAHITAQAQEIERLRTVLTEIAKAEGHFNRDPLTHANNVITAMVRLAEKAVPDE